MQQTGRVSIKLGSDTLRTKPGAVFQAGGITRDFEITDQLESYYKEKPVVAMVRGTVVHASDTDLVKLRAWKDATVYYETDSGHTYTIPNAAVVSIGDLANGEFEVTISGDPAVLA